MRTAIVALALGLAGAPGVDQDLSRLLQTSRTTAATLKGTIRGSAGEVLSDERIALATIGGTILYRNTTNATGAYFFENLRSGLYAVILERDARRVELGRVQIVPGHEFVRDFTKGVIVPGAVVDEAGAPVGGVTVCLLRAAGANAPQFSPVASARADARGEFIIGERLDLRSGMFTAAVMPAGCAQAASPDLVTARLARYPPTYFPDTTSARDASFVFLEPKEDRAFKFRLRPGAVTRLEGRITGYKNTSVVPGIAILEPPQNEPALIVRTTKIGATGSFVFAGLVPGEYRVIVPPQKGPDAPGWAMRTVTIGGEPVTRVPIAMQPTVAVGGRVDFAGHMNALSGTRIFLTVNADRVGDPAPLARLLGGGFGAVGLDGTFGITGLMPGSYRLSVSGADAVGWLPERAIVSVPGSPDSGVDAFDVPFTLGPNQSLFGVKVEMTYKPSSLAGRVEYGDGSAAGQAFVVLFPTDARYWLSRSRRVVQTRSLVSGEYTFAALPVGDYLAVALGAVPKWPADPDWLESLRPFAVPVTLGPGETRLTLRMLGSE